MIIIRLQGHGMIGQHSGDESWSERCGMAETRVDVNAALIAITRADDIHQVLQRDFV